ncbi:hypothetical protein ACJMK2_043956 [Sinanodonta woodiana]|uniref:HAT C-terminal dimerisation domain-containing protein n=1 Tax=Sinanodonta woodiana TaxID=1069815 RepID=A0ABD3VYI5_SINWO
MIIPGVRLLERYLQRTKNPGDDAGIQTMRTEIYTDLHARFQHLMTNKTCVVATVLDATYKLRFFDSNEKANARQILLEVALKEIRTRRSKTARVTSATHVESERSFSSASDICEDKRSSLAPHKLEQLLFLKKNLSVVNFNY